MIEPQVHDGTNSLYRGTFFCLIERKLRVAFIVCTGARGTFFVCTGVHYFCLYRGTIS
jgi:hypothetical protein